MMNQVLIEGFAGADAEMLTFTSGRRLTKLRVATKETWDGGSRTDWHNVVEWGNEDNPGDLKLITKGSRVRVKGSIRYRSYDKDGVKHWVTDIVCDQVEKLSHSNRNGDE
jgi:single-strand DNA-binding protein